MIVPLGLNTTGATVRWDSRMFWPTFHLMGRLGTKKPMERWRKRRDRHRKKGTGFGLLIGGPPRDRREGQSVPGAKAASASKLLRIDFPGRAATTRRQVRLLLEYSVPHMKSGEQASVPFLDETPN